MGASPIPDEEAGPPLAPPEAADFRARWEREVLAPLLEKRPERRPLFRSPSGREIPRIVSPRDLAGRDYRGDLGRPGEFPYTRGIHPGMYRTRLWTQRLFAGFGTAEETNRRFRYLLEKGQTGLSVAFDLPTIQGVDSDRPTARGEVGVCGVAVDSLADMETLFEGIPLDRITTSMTINSPAAVLWAMYLALAEKRGIPWEKLGGTIQNDALKEYIAQKTWIFPPEPSMRLVVDAVEFGARRVPRWNTVSISGYHIREAGSTAAQELAFTLADGLAYVAEGVARGLSVEQFAPRLSFFFDVHLDLFEEVAKFRAARRIWAREMRRRYEPEDERALKLRFHCQTAGCALTARQPENNIVRVAWQALAAALGGAQSLHTCAMDETFGLPTEEAAEIALRTQQIVAHESGLTGTVDPLGGSYYLEWLTCRLEEEAVDYIRRVEEMGGMLAAIARGYPQREVLEAANHYQRRVEAGDEVVVGVNKYADEGDASSVAVFSVDEASQRRQLERLASVRARRDAGAAARALEALRRAAGGEENLMPPILDCVRAYATLGEAVGALKEAFGEYQEPADF